MEINAKILCQDFTRVYRTYKNWNTTTTRSTPLVLTIPIAGASSMKTLEKQKQDTDPTYDV